MPRIRRRGKVLRGLEAPICEWPLTQLMAEFSRLETDPGDLNVWQNFKRKSELGNELYRRGINA